MESHHLEFRLLGRFSVRRGGEEVPQAAFGGRLTRTLLRILLARRGAFVSKDVLADALWSQRLPADPDGNLEILVSRARRALGDRSVILTGPHGYAFSPDARSAVDAEAFLADVEAGRNLRASSREVEALNTFGGALAGWGGEPFAEDAYAEWSQEFRRELARAHLEALEGAASAALAAGHPGQAVGFAERAVAREPLREASQLLLIRALAASGDQAAALGAFESFRAHLAHELGLDPSPDARALHLKILRGELSPASQPARTAVVTAPVTTAPLPPPEAFPFVGRAEELDLVLSVARPGGSPVLTVAGPSGSGKSRLLAEAAARCPVRAIVARAYLPERDEPWALARVLLREALALDVHAARTLPDLCAKALADTLPELEEDRAASERFVDPESRRSLAFEGAVRILRSIASEGAVILVDDLQWADATSLDLVHLAVRRVGGLGLVAAYRPEEVVAEASVARFLARLGEVQGARSVVLGPLSAEAIADLVEGEALARVVIEETDRSPLAVGEVLRVLVERGLVERGVAGRSRPRSEFAPEVAREAARAGQQRAVEGRVRRLASEARAVLNVLSLAGRELPARTVAEAIGQEQAAVLHALDELVRAGLVRLGEQGWGTAHDSISEALVAHLPPADRARLHSGLAEALRKEGGEVAEVARHLSGAGDNQAAASAFAQAARQALNRFANDEAARLADAGLALSPGSSIRAALSECRAEARARKGDVGGAREDLREALSSMSARPERSRALTSMAVLASGSEDYGLADELIDLALVEAASDPVSRAEALVAGAIIDINVGRFDRSEARSSEAMPLFERIGDASGVARVLDARALGTFQAGRLFEAAPALDRAAHLLIDTGQLIRAVNPRSMRGNALVLMSQPEKGLLDIDQALDLARRLDHPNGESFCLSMRCLALSALGRTAEAVEEGERALDIAEAIGHREWKVISMRALGRAWEEAGNLESAEGWLRAALSLSGGMPILATWVAARLALVLVARGDLDAAEASLIRGMTEDAPLPMYDARLARAELLAARGDRDAPVVAAAALARAEAGGYLVVVPRLQELAARQTAR